LAGVQGDVFGPDKKAEGGGAPGGGAAPAPAIKPGAGGMAGTFDPNYQTLAGMNADVFGKDKKA
uniref:Sugar ABC transporter substrate-binding protein n=1 Tax=Heligmosomoides polygyrus TaxID=6339 RepID=A0A183GFL7_HELPZ